MDMRVKPKLRGFVNCSTNQFLLVYNYFIAQGHRHRGRFLFLVVLVFSDGSEPEKQDFR